MHSVISFIFLIVLAGVSPANYSSAIPPKDPIDDEINRCQRFDDLTVFGGCSCGLLFQTEEQRIAQCKLGCELRWQNFVDECLSSWPLIKPETEPGPNAIIACWKEANREVEECRQDCEFLGFPGFIDRCHRNLV